jgi:hypothetical protein
MRLALPGPEQRPTLRHASGCLGMPSFCLALVLFASSSCWASPQGPSDPNNDQSAQELVRITVAHEVSACNQAGTKLMFLSRKRNAQGLETRLYVETTDATAGLLLEKNNHQISDQQMREETERLNRLRRNPNELRRKQRQEHDEAEHSLRIVRALPDAFLYRFDGTEPGTSSVGKAGDELVRLQFRPNPRYSPPSHVEQVLAGMQGTLLIDKDANRIARIDATLFKEVTFGWGILGHLDKGGTLLVNQAEVSPGDWELTHMRLNLTGKVMMLKSLVIRSEETDSDFHVIPSDTTFAEGVELLKAEEAKLQQARSQKAEPAHTAANSNRR